MWLKPTTRGFSTSAIGVSSASLQIKWVTPVQEATGSWGGNLKALNQMSAINQ
jgi:hypothetical protein